MFQSYLGIKWDYDKWNDVSEEQKEKDIAKAKNRLETIESFDTTKLSEQEKLSLRLYKLGIERDLANDEFRHHSYVVHQFRAAHTQVPSFLINIHGVKSKEDAQAYISRLDNVSEYFKQVIEQMKLREQAGVFPPAWAYEQMIAASQNVVTGAPFDTSDTPSTIWEDFNTKVDNLELDDVEKTTLLGEAKAALVTSVMPAYKDFIQELEHQKPLPLKVTVYGACLMAISGIRTA